MTNILTKLPIAILLATLTGCQIQPPVSPNGADLPDAGSDGTYHVDFPDQAQPETRHLLMTVSEDMSSRCGMEPHFAFDKAEVKPQGRVKLAFVAECLKSNALDDYDVMLVGHADRRGTDDYNYDLALERAKNVKKILAGYGVSADRLRLGTKGEQVAVGGDEKFFSHGFDRRVDVIILGQDAAPEESGVRPYVPTGS